MLKSIAAIALCLLSCRLTAQTYFEGLYGDSITAGGIIHGSVNIYPEGYLVWTAKFDFGTFRWTPHMFEINEEGTLTSEFYPAIPDSISEQYGGAFLVNDTMLIGMSYQHVLTQSSSTQGDIVLTCLSPQGQIFWRQVYGFPNRTETPQRFTRCSDGGYAIVGQVVLPQGENGNGEVYLIRTDSLGNQLWEQMYGGSLYESGSDLIETLDGGFLLLGWTRSYGFGERDFYLVKTDSVGSLQWDRTYGDSYFDSGSSIIGLSDGNYLLGGYRNLNEKRQGYLYKIDATGAVIWENDFGDDGTTEEFNGILELPNGDIAAVGLYDPYGAAPQSDNGGLLVRINNEGEEIWRRVYQKNDQTDLFYTMLATEDGGFLLGGQAWNTENSSQDAWLLKVDSVGCAYPNCITGVDEEEPTKVMVDVWPNPATDFLNVEIVGNSTYLDLQVFDISGREILRFTQYDRQATIDTGHWNSGIYILKGTDESGRGFNVKVVKQ